MSAATELTDVTAAMEEWRFPAAYDQDYLPAPDSPYWFPHRETMDPWTAAPTTSRPGTRSRRSRW